MENLKPSYKFRKIGELGQTTQRELVDIVAVVASVQPVQALTRKDGSAMEKRSVYVRDDSNHTIEVTMWAPFASREGNQLEQARRAQRSAGQRSAAHATSEHTHDAVC